ncbi:hypothetical protein BFP97_00710 [Roseivirga sp. 4D4]|nr:hypothetical protein BFP97_00710 [Roseivirga sp. 4D4]
MLSNYLKIAFRNALRYKGYTFLNLFGLVVGIASTMLVLMWIDDERSIDKFHENGDEIYQVFRNMKQSNGMVSTTTSTPKPLGDLVRDEYSEVDQVVWLSQTREIKIQLEDQLIDEGGSFASPEVLDMFTFEMLLGDESTALSNVSNIVIAESVALKYFGQNWRNEAMGKILRIEDAFDAIVSGVFKDLGDKSTLDFNWLMNAQVFIGANSWVNDWGNGSFMTFIRISDESKVQTVSDKILMEIKDHTVGNPNAGDEEVIIYKFEDTYLYSKFDNGVVSGGRIDFVRIMTIVAIFILIVACINFMNLTTARSSRRSKEIGLRKVMGAPRKSIRTQFYFEAFLLTLIAVVISVFVVIMAMPYFNDLVGKQLSIDFSDQRTWYFLIGLTFSVGLVSGSYPAVLLPAISIVQSIKGAMKQPSYAAYFRKGLVIFQFAVSTLLIIGTTVVYKQIDYVLNKDLGLNKDNLLAVAIDQGILGRLDTYKSELMRLPDVKAVSAASGNPLDYGRSTSSTNWEGKNPADGYEVNVMLTDEDLISTMGMEMLKGRDFSLQLEDSTNFIINEVAAEMMGFDDPLGKKLSFWGIDGRIIGVVKNFHMRNLYEPIAPLIITCIDPQRSNVVLVRIGDNMSETISAIEKVTAGLSPDSEFEYQFIDEAYEESYRNEKTVSKLANIFALISILISSLGLFGLASYSAEQRSREIGVRKVHGASVLQILMLLSKDYSKLILIAFVVSVPFGYMVTQNWLDDFEFRTSLDPLVFIIAGIVAFLIGVLTVAAKSYQAASVNPVRSLKQE